MINFTLFTANCVGNLSNCIYPNKAVITDKDTLMQAMQFDHITAEYTNNYRNNGNFTKSDNVPLDCDNDHSDNPQDWVASVDVAMTFPNVTFAVVYSRNHMKAKGGKSARPRFHVYFMTPEITTPNEYATLKQKITAEFTYCDTNALDSARLLFGTPNPQVEIYDGELYITDFLDSVDFENWDKATQQIPEGKRNSTMSHAAGKIVKRYGDTDEAYNLFIKTADKCTPPLDVVELDLIWNSAVAFEKRISGQDRYIPPEVYNSDCKLKPTDFSDVGQATVLAREFADTLRYSTATDYIVYNGSFWEESKPKSQAVAQLLTEKQLEEAEAEMKKAMKEMVSNGAAEIIAAMGSKKAVSAFNKEQAHTFNQYDAACTYRNYAIKRRDSKYIGSDLKEAHPMLEIEQRVLDADEFLLNTPTATYNLKTGAVLEQNAEHFITKQTTVDPSDVGSGEWETALNTFFLGDAELAEYVQKIVGLSAIGKVYVEALVIAYGEGRNGKSTFWNAISRVLGSYSGNISADMLTVGCRQNVKPELAEAKGKRLLIAAELEEGMRLNTSNVKQLCSTDEIYAEKKYKDPFSYIPSHTLVLYTNHLPKVKDAIASYKENNDWLSHFLTEYCEMDDTYSEKSGQVYNEYRAFCLRTGEFTRSTADFYTALDAEGFEKHKNKTGAYIKGIKLKSEFLE